MRLQRRILLCFRTLFSSAHSPARRTVCTLRCCFRTPSKTGSRAALKRTPDPLAEAQHIYTSRKFLRPLCCFAPPLSILVYQEPLSGYRFYRAYFPEPGLVFSSLRGSQPYERLNQYNPRVSTSGVPASSSGSIAGYPLEEAQAASLTN